MRKIRLDMDNGKLDMILKRLDSIEDKQQQIYEIVSGHTVGLQIMHSILENIVIEDDTLTEDDER